VLLFKHYRFYNTAVGKAAALVFKTLINKRFQSNQ
jgi:hypothetical protein